MPLDPNIILQGQAPQFASPLDMATKAMTLKQLAQEGRLRDQQVADQNSMREAFRNNVVSNPDGSQSINQKGVIAALNQSNPLKAMEVQKSFTEMGREEQKALREKAISDLDMTSRTMGAVKDPESYAGGVNFLKSIGVDTSRFPQQYDPNFIKTSLAKAMTYKEQLEMAHKDRELDIKDKEAMAKLKKEGGSLSGDLRKERSGLPTTKATQEVSAAYNKIQSSAKSPSAAGDMALIFNYMKILDPGSTVREGEYATAQQATGVPGKILNAYNNALKGEKLNSAQRMDFVNHSGKLYKAQLDVQKQIDDQFSSLARKSGIDPNDVLLNFEANSPQSFSQDVVAYAEKHGITPEAALQIKLQRTGQRTAGQ